jgi:hypothetical protein
MSSVYRIFTEHLGAEKPSSFISKSGDIWFDPANNEIRFSDGITPGGKSISLGNNTLSTNSLTLSSLSVSNTITLAGISSDNYTLDDFSFATDGFVNSFPLTFNQKQVSLNSPFNLQVFVNGLAQKPFILYDSITFQSSFMGSTKGFTIDTFGKIRFSSSLPQGSSVMVRTSFGTVSTTKNLYPFKPIDILLGY